MSTTQSPPLAGSPPGPTGAFPAPPREAPPRRRSPGAWALLTVAGIVAAAAVADGASTLVTLAMRQSASGAAPAVTGVTSVAVSTPHCGGDVDLRPTAAGAPGAGTAQVSWRDSWGLRRPVHSAAVRGGVLTVRVDCSVVDPGWGSRSDLALQVPAGVPVTVDAGSGDVAVRDLSGALDLRTGSGDVLTSGATGDLALRTGSGEITATGTRGARITARAGSGDVDVSAAAAPSALRVHSGSGDVTVAVPSGGAPYAVSTDTGSGDVHVRVARDAGSPHRLDLHTGSGDLTVRATP